MRKLKKLPSVWLIVLLNLVSINVYSQNMHSQDIFAPKFEIIQNIRYKGFYSIKLNAEAPCYAIFGKVKTEDLLPKFKLKTDSFSFRFSPILVYEKNTITPALSFFYGGLNVSSHIIKLSEPDFSIKETSYSGIKFLPNNFIQCSSAKQGVSKAVEFSLKNFNAFVLAEQTRTKRWANLHFSFAYKFSNDSIKCGLVLYSLLYPSIYSKIKIKPFYNQIHSSKITFIGNSKFGQYKFLLAGSLNLPTGDNKDIQQAKNNKQTLINLKNEKIAGTGEFEFNYFGNYTGFNSGIIIKQKNFFNPKRKKEKEVFLFFFRPNIIIDFFEFKGIYNYSKNYDQKKQAYSFFHTGGINIKFRLLNYLFYSNLYYQKEKWKLDSEFKIKNLAFWQKEFIIIYSSSFENKNKNPFIVKKYSVFTSFKINCNKDLVLDFFGKIRQENKVMKEKNKPPKIEWQKTNLKGGIGLEFNKKEHYCNHSLKFKIEIFNVKPHFSVNLAYKIQSNR